MRLPKPPPSPTMPVAILVLSAGWLAAAIVTGHWSLWPLLDLIGPMMLGYSLGVTGRDRT